MLDETVFDTFPVLETERLILREIRLSDAEEVFRIYSDPQVMRFWGSAPMASLEEARGQIAGRAAAFSARSGIRWAITRKGDDRLIGSCGHWRLIKQHMRSEIGYDLAPELWGQGIMPEAVGAILRFGFERMGLHSVEAQIEPDNQGSRRVLDKLGFVQEGYFRENYYFDGEFTDTAVFSLLKADWLASI
ncbi:MAG TPA: GNAT family protein [Roseiflexaceae bacterium]|nr:GNAT family protein [Roseiflexaceae bacterium]